MKPLMLKMEKFGSYKNLCEIDFEKISRKGIFLIDGATGSGKTTVFDGVCTALFGSASGEKRKKSELLSDYDNTAQNRKPKTGMVELVFILHGKKYRIKREFKLSVSKTLSCTCSFFELSENGEKEVKFKGEEECNEYIKNMLGIGIKQFRQVAMLAQGAFRKFIDSGDGDLEKILRDIFKTEKYRDFGLKIADAVKSLENEYKTAYSEISAAFSGAVLCDEDREKFAACALEDDKLDIVKNAVENDGILLKQTDESLKTADEKYISVSTALSKAVDINRYFDDKEKYEKDLLDIAPNGEYIENLKRQLDKADRAEKAVVYINAEKKAYADADERQKQLAEYIKLRDERQNDKKRLSDELAEQKKNEGKITALNIEADNIKKILPKYEMLAALDGEIKSCAESKIKYDKQIEKLADKNDRLLKNQQSLKNEESDLKDCRVQKEKNAAKISALNQQKNKCLSIKKRYGIYNDLCAEYKYAAKKAEISLSKWTEANDGLTAAETLFLQNQAGIIAQRLEEGKPCPVCGTYGLHEVRVPAVCSAEAPTEKQLEKMRKDTEKLRADANAQAQNAAEQRAKMTGAADELKKEGDDAGFEYGSIEELFDLNEKAAAETAESEKQLKAEAEELEKAEKRYFEVLSELSKNEKAVKTNSDGLEELKNKAAEISEKSARLSTQRDMLQNELTQYKSRDDAQNRLAAVRREAKRISDSIEKAQKKYNDCAADCEKLCGLAVKAEKEAENAAKAADEASNLTNKMLGELSFADRDDVLSVDYKKIKNGGKTAESIEKYKALSERLKELEKRLDGRQRQDTAALEKDAAELKAKKDELNKNRGAVLARIEANKNTAAAVSKKMEKAGKINEKYISIKGLADSGLKDFERYVQTYYLDRILQGANRRLSQMTNGNFILHRPNSGDVKSRNNTLSLWVYDRTTDTDRAASTLSGGESFKAALALALGMSDEIQNTNTGIEINTVFVDEGFGSLDDESREQAVRVLMDMAQTDNRVVGIISHVTELRHMIDSRIEVKKDADGSRVRLVC